MSKFADQKSGLAWPSADYIDKAELIKLILSLNPDKSKKQVHGQIRNCQNYRSKKRRLKHRLPSGYSFENKTAADWVRALYPEMTRLDGFPPAPQTGYFDSEYFADDVDVPPPDELDLAYRQCRNEIFQLKKRNRFLEEENIQLKQKLGNRGRKKGT